MSNTTLSTPSINVQAAVKGVTALATLPEVTTRIIATVEDPNSSASKLHKIIAHDPALVSRILKVVNSAFYGLPGQIGSVERAIVLLGLNAVKNIAVAASLGQLFRGVKLSDKFTARDLWTHCIAVGVASRELAKAMKFPFADEAFLSGLIHDIGILVELQTWPEQLRTVCNTVVKQGANFCETEQMILGVDHQTLGKALADHWKFPQTCQQVALHHHNPAAAAVEMRPLVTIVHAADIIACRAEKGFNLTALGQELDSACLAEAGLTDEILQNVAEQLPTTLSDAGGLFD